MYFEDCSGLLRTNVEGVLVWERDSNFRTKSLFTQHSFASR